MSWLLEVNPHATKCKEFLEAIDEDENDFFITFLAMEGYKTTYYIKGKPNFTDDGCGHYDDMTGSREILFCPFCGEKL